MVGSSTTAFDKLKLGGGLRLYPRHTLPIHAKLLYRTLSPCVQAPLYKPFKIRSSFPSLNKLSMRDIKVRVCLYTIGSYAFPSPRVSLLPR